MNNFKILTLILIVFLNFSCSTLGENEQDELPKVLIIGDSISIGYTPSVYNNLSGIAAVYRNPQNARDTATGVNNLESWLGTHQWEVIHFNHGLHDLQTAKRTTADKYVLSDNGEHLISLDNYEENLDLIVKRLKKTGAKLIFATTTPVQLGSNRRKQEDVDRYNATALKIMKKYDVDVNDLYNYTLSNLSLWQLNDKVHFNAVGNRAIGERVTQVIYRHIAGMQTPISP